jgi:hypothetical protein
VVVWEVCSCLDGWCGWCCDDFEGISRASSGDFRTAMLPVRDS